MLDASGHDVNCAFAADPRSPCDCGGKKRGDMRNHFTAGNDDSGLAAMAGDMPQAAAMERKISTVQQQLAANKDKAIALAADAAFGAGKWNKAGMRGAIHPGGREVYSYLGRDFIELAPVEFTNEQAGETFTITAVQKWKILEPQP